MHFIDYDRAQSSPSSPAQIHILSLRKESFEDKDMRLETLHVIDSPWSAVLLRENLIAFGDHSSTTVLMDWTTQESAILESASDPTIPRQVSSANRKV